MKEYPFRPIKPSDIIQAIAAIAIIVGVAGVLSSIVRQYKKTDPDFVMRSQTAVSNAMRFGKPAEGFGIACDNNGHWAPINRWGQVMVLDYLVRTSRFEAIVATWRVLEVITAPKEPTPPETMLPDGQPWKPCDE